MISDFVLLCDVQCMMIYFSVCLFPQILPVTVASWLGVSGLAFEMGAPQNRRKPSHCCEHFYCYLCINYRSCEAGKYIAFSPFSV